MRHLLGFILLVLWLAAFFAPFALLYWSLSHGGPWLGAHTGWSRWLSTPAVIAGCVVVCALWTVGVWPRLFGVRGDSAGPKPVVKMPAATPLASSASSGDEMPTDAARIKQPATPTHEGLRAPDASVEWIRAVNRDALALADAGDHTGACRATARLNQSDPMQLASPDAGVNWYTLEDSADRSTDRAAARFVYELCIAHEEWATAYATGSGEAMSAKVAISKLRSKM